MPSPHKPRQKKGHSSGYDFYNDTAKVNFTFAFGLILLCYHYCSPNLTAAILCFSGDCPFHLLNNNRDREREKAKDADRRK